MKNWIFILFLSLGFAVNAQRHVIHEGKAYEVKRKSIFSDGADITHTLHKDKKDYIFKTHKSQVRADKRAEKARKKQEKAQKKAARDLKKKQKAQKRYLKVTKRLEKNQTKYDRLKERGRLSPKAEEKWLKRLDRYKQNAEKLRKRL